MLECHVQPIAVILRPNPSGRPETQDEADLSEDDLVGCKLGPVSGFQLVDLCFLAFEDGAVWREADLCFAQVLPPGSIVSTLSAHHESRIRTAKPATITP